MKKNGLLLSLILLFLIILLIGCQSKQQEKTKTIALADSTATQFRIDSTDEQLLDFQDTLHLEQGEIPEGWQKVELGKGYYIGFPKGVSQTELKKKKQKRYFYRKPKYAYFASTTELDEEPLFKEHRQQVTLFYDAVLKDLMFDLAPPGEGEEMPEIIKKIDFLFLDIYPALRAELEAADFYLYIDLIIIGRKLFSVAFINYEEKADPALLQHKDRFFYSMGKDIAIID